MARCNTGRRVAFATQRTALQQVVLLTGAAGFIGCFVLAELVSASAHRPTAVVCLVRGSDHEDAQRQAPPDTAPCL